MLKIILCLGIEKKKTLESILILVIQLSCNWKHKAQFNSKVFHGEAVIAGIIIELYLSHKALNFSIDIVRKIKGHLENIFDKIYISSNEIKHLFSLLQFDKKNFSNKVNFVLLKDIGNCEIDINVKNEIIREAIDFYNS